ncbi:hypothetical protein C8J57DRAFT_1017539, partial [Mycena rebaudengoi]
RRLMRMVPEYLPFCGTISAELSLHILTNRDNVSNCLLHSQKKSKSLVAVVDGSGKNGSFVAGRAYDNGKVPASESTRFLDCGCHRDEALLELFVYKVVRARSHHPKLKHHEESLGKDVFLTRPRTFLAQGLLCAVGLTVHDLYTGEMTELG